MRLDHRQSPRTLHVAAILSGLALSARAQCPTTSFSNLLGGPIPTSGSGNGDYPFTLPSAPLVLPIPIVIGPAGEYVIDSIELRGLDHTSVGDVQIVLESPSGARYNVLNRLGGFSCDFNGDYRFISASSCAGSPLGVPGSCAGAAVLPPGNYAQSFGNWPNDGHGIKNTPLESIPISSGLWNVVVYDWASGEAGDVAEARIVCKTQTGSNQRPDPPSCIFPEDGTITESPVNFSWAASRADTHKIRVNRVVPPGTSNPVIALDGLGSPSHPNASLPAGEYEWTPSVLKLVNGVMVESTNNPTCTFCIEGRYCLRRIEGLSFPAFGAIDGTWPAVLPTGEFVSSQAIVVPPGATALTSLRLSGLSHSWIGDCHVVLESPSGVRYNVFQDVDGVFGGGCAASVFGDYIFVDKVLGIVNCPTYSQGFACSGAILPPGVYLQHHGAWPDGAAGIFNTPLSAIPISSGTWTLRIYDWYVAVDSGFLTSWDLCFDIGASNPVLFCTSGTTTNGCNALISATAQPSASFGLQCTLNVSNVEGAKQGLLFYGINNSGFTPTQWGGTSFLCVKAPIQRMGVQSSGGVPNTCSGALTQNLNSFLLSHPSALGSPLSVGDTLFAQAWFRDPPATKTSSLSNAIELTVQP